jgi:mycothiol synthase
MPPLQLHMIWPGNRLKRPPTVRLAKGYRIRSFRDGDEKGYLALRESAGFKGWTETTVAEWRDRALPDGFLVVEHVATGDLVATAMAAHRPQKLHPAGGELGWVAGSPAHAGKGLGAAVCGAVVRRFLGAGYGRIYLQTDDWRLAAVKVYLKMGFVPFLASWDMAGRWKALCDKLGVACPAWSCVKAPAALFVTRQRAAAAAAKAERVRKQADRSPTKSV